MRKTLRRCPEVEALEPLRLLSGSASMAEPVAVSHPLDLAGSLRGLTFTKGSPTFSVVGALAPLGHVSAAGHGSIGTVTSTNGSFSLLTGLGRVFVATDVASVAKRSFAGEYTIQGGSGAYAGETGSGRFAVSYYGSTFMAEFG
jgi:hypothetical protein